MFLRRYIERFKASCFRQKTRSFSITRVFIIVILFSLVTFFILSYKLMTPRHVRKMPHPPVPKVHCRFERKMQFAPRDHNTRDNLQISKKVLVIAESHYPKLVRQIVQTLELARFDYKIESTGKHLPPLTHLDKGRWSVIIFENLEAYLAMDQWNREMIDKYCKDFKVGMIIFVHSSDELGIDREKVTGFPLILRYNMGLRDFHLNMYSEMWRIARPGEVIDGPLEDDDWTVFEYHNNTYEPLAFARAAPNQFIEGTEQDNSTLVAAILDVGKHDGIKRVFFGNSLEFWLHRLMMVDALSYLSHGKLSLSLDRYIQIDVDDIFVGITGTRMTAADVEAMVQAQERFQKKVEGFMFNMGFSGYYFQTGDNPENEGDKKILEYKNKFWWFGHMWKHEHSHKFPQQRLEQSMLKNYQFAKEMKIPVHHQYAVAPLHAGVFPIHEELYNAWKNVWDIRVTSTEEYPRLHPAWRRRGFIYKGVMVLPRQTCGLFTHTMYFDEYPGGPQVLDKSIQGGELFLTFLFNPINIFMTHMSNYGNDRLALYTFESAFKFVQCWTNLRLKQVPPLEMGIKYFEMYPEEKDPVWRNPCSYKRHLEIWSENKTCDRLPKFMVIGPQKTGTTALYTFLSMHPAIISNYNSSETFEEVQFFNGNNYYKGLDWYMNFFPIPPNATSDFLFEKSATYFDSELAPHRAHALLPKAKLICILIHPAKRAYSWYQHIKAHKDPIAMNHSFYEVITATSLAPQKLQSLRNRCLMPGIYVQHLSRWLDFYPARQLFIVDGEKLKNQPAAVMHNVQRFLHIEPHYEYNDLLRFDPKKGFYCQTMSNNKSKCLGRSKGRKYPPMDQKSMAVLQQFYSKHNVALSHLLEKYKYRIPNWLEQELSSSR